MTTAAETLDCRSKLIPLCSLARRGVLDLPAALERLQRIR